MKRRNFLTAAAGMTALAWLGFGIPARAEEDFVYGRELMTEQEMAEHRARMRSLKTEEEREAYRQEHHRLMQERARERGVTIPEEPLGRGMGMGAGPRTPEGLRGTQGAGGRSMRQP